MIKDFRGRVGKGGGGREHVLGTSGGNKDTGETMIDFCVRNDPESVGGFFRHGESQRFTRQME